MTGWTWINLGAFLSPGRILGSLKGVGIPLDLLVVTGFPFASKPMSLWLGLPTDVSNGSSGRESSKDGACSTILVSGRAGGWLGLYG